LGEFDPDFVTFFVIDDQTDALPVGESRKHWAPDALAQKDRELAQIENSYRNQALEAASHLVARFADEKRPESAYT
jgi:hypothetical protein